MTAEVITVATFLRIDVTCDVMNNNFTGHLWQSRSW